MNEKIKELAAQAGVLTDWGDDITVGRWGISGNYEQMQQFAELIVQECRTVINDVYHKTPLELCGPLLTVDEEIMNHFYGVDLK